MRGVNSSDVTVLVAAALSFVAAIAAVVVGQILTQKFQQDADKRRWEREDVLRRRTRSEEMARQAIEHLAKVTDLVGWDAGSRRDADAAKGGHYVEADGEEITDLCRPVRRAALEIDNDAIVQHLEKSCDLLGSNAAARMFGAPHPARTGWAVQKTCETLVSAYLRDRPLDADRSDAEARAFRIFDTGYSACEELWSEYEHEDDEDSES